MLYLLFVFWIVCCLLTPIRVLISFVACLFVGSFLSQCLLYHALAFHLPLAPFGTTTLYDTHVYAPYRLVLTIENTAQSLLSSPPVLSTRLLWSQVLVLFSPSLSLPFPLSCVPSRRSCPSVHSTDARLFSAMSLSLSTPFLVPSVSGPVIVWRGSEGSTLVMVSGLFRAHL
ncbi:hypothetical protein FRC20_008976 [Serendipita sp. 405]|nr:hypothetical protein FRC20_008976 [Serendipita sp. 405]